ncbi:unknown similar to AMEV033 [Mythimna separata entomopoxvirus 'L']|uniref:Uncharacterized protein n=1 Tax=Mythimna separata entomopoxvirus 'L' TaxID=1293572 RepID=A0A916KQF3_9POXV|nr:unknown similar to AMEV033 [Mythimna separata entomopoxvirus 'L']CCU56340.1 unknown similar to AMEV033 [Mythimna separata entomopoxvirus 'L']
MYDDILELLYNNKITLFTNKNFSDSLTGNIFDNLQNNIKIDFITNIYNKIKNIFNDYKTVIKGGIATQILLDQPLNGDLDLEISISSKLFNSILLNNKTLEFNDIFSNIDKNFLINELDNSMRNYITYIKDSLNNIDFNSIIPDTCKFNNKFYIANSYQEEYIEIPYIDRFIESNYINNIKMKMSIINNKFILIRFYYDIIYDYYNKIHYNSIESYFYTYRSRFLFLDISIVPDKNIEIIDYNVNQSIINMYNINYIISDQLLTLISSFITKIKMIKRIDRFEKIMYKYRNYLDTDNNIIDQIDSNIGYKIMFSKYENVIRNNISMKNYYIFKYNVCIDKFIYILKNVSFFEVKESELLYYTPKNYIKLQLNKLFNIIDSIMEDNNQINNNISGNNTDFIIDKNIINILIKEFNLSNNDITEIVNDPNTYKYYLEVYNKIKNKNIE